MDLFAARAARSCALAGDDAELEIGLEQQELSASSAGERAQLALRWAPIHYMDVDPTGSHALSGRSDFITRIDFDGDFNARNNWENAASAGASFAAHAYYSVVETSSHWFIVYLFFHPRDWTDFFVDTEHENDAEGVLLSVERDGSTYGVLRSAVTVLHDPGRAFAQLHVQSLPLSVWVRDAASALRRGLGPCRGNLPRQAGCSRARNPELSLRDAHVSAACRLHMGGRQEVFRGVFDPLDPGRVHRLDAWSGSARSRHRA